MRDGTGPPPRTPGAPSVRSATPSKAATSIRPLSPRTPGSRTTSVFGAGSPSKRPSSAAPWGSNSRDRDKEEELDASQLQALLAQKEDELMELQQHLESEQRRNALLESELTLALAAAQRAEEEHSKEMAKVEGDVTRALAERRSLVEKLAAIEVVEDAVRELYVQMKDRVADDGPPTPELLQQEKAELKSENILVVLGGLHAILKNLWAFKVEAEEDLRGTRTLRLQQSQQGALILKDRIRQLEADVRAAKQEAAASKLQLQVEQEAREALMDESRRGLAEMAGQQQELVGALRNAQAEGGALRAALQAAMEEGRRRDGLVLRNKQLESARHFDRVAGDKELRRMQVEHSRQLQSMSEELAKVARLMAENDRLRERMQQALRSADSYRHIARTAPNRFQLESKMAQLEAEIKKDTVLASALAHLEKAGLAGSVDATDPGTVAPQSPSGKDTSKPKDKRVKSQAEKVADLMRSIRQDMLAQEEALRKGDPDADPLYNVITNVNKMQRQAKAALKEIKKELVEAQPGYSKQIQQSMDANRGLSNVQMFLAGKTPVVPPPMSGVGAGVGGLLAGRRDVSIGHGGGAGPGQHVLSRQITSMTNLSDFSEVGNSTRGRVSRASTWRGVSFKDVGH